MTIEPFVYTSLPNRVVFGAGRIADVGTEVARLGADRLFLVADDHARAPADAVAGQLGDRVAGRWHEVVQHVPVDLAARARDAATAARADAVVCIGGGSATGLAKAIALTHKTPIVAVPTTYAGSELTPIYGLTGGRHKQTGTSLDVLPRVVVYDPELTVGLPPGVTGPSAFNALAHSVESLYAPGCNPITSTLALEAVRVINRSLPAVMADSGDIAGRGDLLFGAYLSGLALGATSAALHHKLCHVLGGTFDLVHADAHSVVLPHAVALVAPALPDEMAALATALDSPDGDPAAALWDLAARSGVPTSLAALGLDAADLPDAAQRAATEITDSPTPVDAAILLGLLRRAHAGDRPSRDVGDTSSTPGPARRPRFPRRPADEATL